jgi:predicted ATPase
VLTRLHIQNFRLLRDVTIEFEGRGQEGDVPTVFIGPNGAGKSTVLEVLDFLGRCSTSGVQAAALAHGGLANVRTGGVDEPVRLEAKWSFVTNSKARQARHWRLRWSISLLPAMNGGVLVQREELVDDASGEKRAIVTTDDSGARAVWPENTPKGEPSKVTSRLALAFEEVTDATRFPALYFLRSVVGEINIVGAISTAPAWARAESSQLSPRDSLVIGPKKFLDRQGLGLANVLFGIFTDHAAAWQELEKAFRAEFPFVKRIIFPPDVSGSKITFAFEDERFPGRKLFASEMSDGMITYLCLLASILNPEQGGMLGLDEPDANLHPSALRRLMSLAHRQHGRRALAIVTHSNALLDELQTPAKSIRVVEPTMLGATVRQLDAEALEAWRKDYGISGLRRTGLLDKANADYEADEPASPSGESALNAQESKPERRSKRRPKVAK